MTLAELCTRFNLPSTFVQDMVQARMNTIIHGQMDHSNSGTLFTEAYVARQVCLPCVAGPSVLGSPPP